MQKKFYSDNIIVSYFRTKKPTDILIQDWKIVDLSSHYIAADYRQFTVWLQLKTLLLCILLLTPAIEVIYY